jgi:hypothetical protein
MYCGPGNGCTRLLRHDLGSWYSFSARLVLFATHDERIPESNSCRCRYRCCRYCRCCRGFVCCGALEAAVWSPQIIRLSHAFVLELAIFCALQGLVYAWPVPLVHAGGRPADADLEMVGRAQEGWQWTCVESTEPSREPAEEAMWIQSCPLLESIEVVRGRFG